MVVAANRHGPWLKVFAAVLLGCVLLQTAWSLAVPTFRGVDEYEHAYKAAAVARGDWTPHHRSSPTEWGEVVVVPADLVEAARPTCESLPNTDCDPLGPASEGQVEIPTSAGRYNPLFYFVIGTVARPFSGEVALYAMRATAGLLCACLIALSALTLRRWSRTAWPVASLLIAGTPMLTYSTMVAAPNGIEMAAALLVWSAVLGMVEADVSRQDLNFYVAMATVGAIPLLVVRSLGPVWLLLICMCALPLVTRSHLGRLAATPAVRRAGVGLSVLAALAVGYTRWAGTNEIGEGTEHFGSPSPTDLLGQVILWCVQTVGTFPARDELAPLGLYILAFLTWWVVTAVAFREGARRDRIALLAVVSAAMGVGLAVTIVSYDAAGAIWQGRYSLPLTVGFALLCGRMMDRRATPRNAGRVLTGAAVFFFVLHAWSILGVAARLREQGALAGTGAAGLALSLITALVVAGTMLITGGLRVAAGQVVGKPPESGETPAREIGSSSRRGI
jgi:hypothetical protein